ncbi:MAG: radical SAM protein [Promethearchaeota archaeon]
MSNRYIIDNKITNEFVEAYTKTNYRIVGPNKHSAIKPCHWLEQKLLTGRANRNCYKGIFGIESHKCLQNTPALPFCNHQCVFCWRDVEKGNLGSMFLVESDEPKALIDEMLSHHRDIIKNHLPLRRYLENYEIMIDLLYYMLHHEGCHDPNSLSRNIHVSKNKVERALNLLKNQKFIHPIENSSNRFEIDKEIRGCITSREEIELLINRELTTPDEIMAVHAEALTPNHAAISLDGEPLLYPMISEYVDEFKERNFTTFIVTNGTLPEILEQLNPLPTQLYITLPAPNEKIYKKICRPMIKDGWKKIKESLSLIPSLSCRTVIRLTAVKNLNIDSAYLKNYVSIVKEANPNFFEIKGFTLQAKALKISERLKKAESVQYYFPEYSFLEEFSEKFQELSGFPLIYKNESSRDFLFTVNWDEDKSPKIKK